MQPSNRMSLIKKWRLRRREQDSETVYVSEKAGVRTLHIGSDTVQSSMRLARPNALELAYTRTMMAFLLFTDEPQRVLMIGLGGGSLAKFIYHEFPAAHVTAVEINPRVAAIAREFFCLPSEGERFRVVLEDGINHLKERPGADVILVDGYDAESQVESLTTREFYRDCAIALAGRGALVVNLWGGDRNFRGCINRISDAFDGRIVCLPAGRPGNVVAVAFAGAPHPLRWDALAGRAVILKAKYALEFPRFVADLAALNAHNAEQLIL
jgi:spermidine synthase